MQAPVHFTLYSRSWCHLCEDMLQALHALADEYSFTVDVIDIDLDQELLAQYDELVPVLTAAKDGCAPVRLCHYFLDEKSVRAFLLVER